MALKQHIVIKDSEILEAVQTASLQWNYFSSRFYDSPAQVLKVRPLGLAWLLLQYDWDQFDTDSVLSSLAAHEEWKAVPCVLFYRPSSTERVQKASQQFPTVRAIVPVPIQAEQLVDVFKHLLDPQSNPMPTSFASQAAPKTSSICSPVAQPVSRSEYATSSGLLPLQEPPPHTQMLGLTKTGSFAPPRMPAPPPIDVAPALPGGSRVARPASPFLAFKSTSSLPLLSRPNANSGNKPVVVQNSVPVAVPKPVASSSYTDVALPKLPVFAQDPNRHAQTQAHARPPAPTPAPPVARQAPAPAPEPEARRSTPPPPGEDARYANLSLSKLRNTQSLPAYVPSPKAVAPKPQMPKEVPQAPGSRTQASSGQSSTTTPQHRTQSHLPTGAFGTPMPTVETTAWPPELLAALETKLAELVGPLAKILLRKAARSHSTWPDLYNAILGHITSPEDKQDFSSFCASLPINSEFDSSDESLYEEANQFAGELTPTVIRFFEESIQDYLGAVGKVVIRQQLNCFKGMGPFIRGMAAQITIPEERTEFLERAIEALRNFA